VVTLCPTDVNSSGHFFQQSPCQGKKSFHGTLIGFERFRTKRSWLHLLPRNFKIVLFSTLSRPVLRPTQPPIQWILLALSPDVKRSGRKADHSSSSSAAVTNGGTIPAPRGIVCN
jgi:hypothetical protein